MINWTGLVNFITACAFALLVSACASPPKLELTPKINGNYTLDPTHTSVIWSISHVGLSNYTGRFDRAEGELIFDAEKPENSRLDVIIDATSLSTGLPSFDEELIYDQKYLDAETYPDIRFSSTKVEKISENTGKVTGNLTLKGKTEPMTLIVTFNGAGKSFGNPGETLGFSAKGELSRSSFGLTHLISFGIGDEVSLRIETEFNEAVSK